MNGHRTGTSLLCATILLMATACGSSSSAYDESTASACTTRSVDPSDDGAGFRIWRRPRYGAREEGPAAPGASHALPASTVRRFVTERLPAQTHLKLLADPRLNSLEVVEEATRWKAMRW